MFSFKINVSPTSRHILFTPQRYHLATNESFSLTSYDFDESIAVATVSYEECRCVGGRRICDKDRGGVYSQSRGMTRRGRNCAKQCNATVDESCIQLQNLAES